MQPFRRISLILVFFFLAKHIRVLVNVVTGNDIAGALIDDVAIVVLVLWYFAWSKDEFRLDRVKLFLVVMFAAALLQAVYFADTLDWDIGGVVFRALSPFRRAFLPLMLVFVFADLMKSEIIKRGAATIERFVKLFTILLWVAIAYNLLEATLRTLSPQFNSLYLDYVYRSILRAGSPATTIGEDIPIAVLLQLNGPEIKRVHGILLEIWASGGVIFACYLFHVFMSGRFRVLSILNGLVFVALVSSGSRQYLAPFIVLNAVFAVRRSARTALLAPVVIPVVLVGAITVLVAMMRSTFVEGDGYFWYLEQALDPMRQNLGLFLFGIGPVGFTPLGQEIEIGFASELHQMMAGQGFLAISLEIGVIMSALLVLFHLVIFRTKGNRARHHQVRDPYTKGLKLLIVINLLVMSAHWSILLDRTIIVFHVFFLSLLYSWSRFGSAYRVAIDQATDEATRGGSYAGERVLPAYARTRGLASSR